MKRIVLSLLSAGLLILSFPPFDFELLAWFGFIPIFFALETKGLKIAFWLSFLTGFLFFLGLVHWIHHVTWIGMVLLVFYLSFYFALFGTGVKFLDNRWGPLWIPSLWVILEFLRSRLFTGFGWGLLGYSQWRVLPLIQFADLTGGYGISFLVIFGNLLFYKVFRKRSRELFFFFIGLAILLVSAFVYGKIRLSSPLSFSTLRASVIQGNIPQDLKWDPSIQDLIMQKYERLTELTSLNHPDIIFWPETAVPGFLPDDEPLLERLVTLNLKIDTYLLVGSPWDEENLAYNSALYLKDGQILQRYDKLHLVPYGEFIPFEEHFPILRELIFTGDFRPGKKTTVFHHPKGTFSVLICFEDIFPDLVRRFAKGSEFLVNITNDAWFGKSGASFQHAQASVFRAIENRRSVLRVANTGYTCLIDPLGRIIQRLERGGESLFVTGHRIWDIPLSKEETFYFRHGDLFVWLCTIVILLGIASSLSTRFRK